MSGVSEMTQSPSCWKRRLALPALLVLLALVVTPLAFTVGAGTEVVDRTSEGRPILIRSPQPSAAKLVALNEEHKGVRTVLNLRGDKPTKDWFQDEARGVEQIGARWVHLNISGTRGLEEGELQQLLNLFEDESAWPIVAHCAGGVHRTGLVVALYRIQYQGWGIERAIREMEEHWFNWSPRDRSAVKDYLRAYQRDPKRRLPARN